MEDTDAPGGIFAHWIVFNIPSDVLELAEGIPMTPTLTSGAKQGMNDFGMVGYGGPDSPSGTHHFYFRLYALDTTLNLTSYATRSQVINAMQGHILEQAEYMGTYQS
jgi:Raf kinase inhibitor-like YbhB/YbcL family protein